VVVDLGIQATYSDFSLPLSALVHLHHQRDSFGKRREKFVLSLPDDEKARLALLSDDPYTSTVLPGTSTESSSSSSPHDYQYHYYHLLLLFLLISPPSLPFGPFFFSLPGTERSARSDEEGRLFLASLSDEDGAFLMAHQGLGNSQKAEVAWLEKRLRETGDLRYEYEEVDVRHFLVSESMDPDPYIH
jgi:hypothetical protein